MIGAATSWLPLVAAIVALGVVAGAIVVAVVRPIVDRPLQRLVPKTRAWAILSLIAFPVALATGLLSIAFVPSVLDALSLIPDHCAHHSNHDFHLCFVHGVPPTAAWPAALLILLFAQLAPAVIAEIRGLEASRRFARALKELGRYDEKSASWLLDSDGVALTIGTVRPEVFASASLATELGSTRFQAVLAHEHEHRRRRDGLVKSLARLLGAFHLASARRALLSALEVACEQACDQRAAAVVGDPVEVASAIVAMSRLESPSVPRFAQTFHTHPIEQRVRVLLDERWLSVPRFSGHAIVAGLALVFVAGYESLHHSFEIAITHLF